MYWLVSTTIINIVINYTVRVIDGNWYVGKVGQRFSKIFADIDIAKQLCKRERYIYDFFMIYILKLANSELDVCLQTFEYIIKAVGIEIRTTS